MNKLKSLDRSSIIYIDESGMNDNDYYPYVYSPIGQRYYESHPGHYTKRISMIAGLCGRNLQAPFMFEGHCNTATFDTYIEKILLPTLKSGMTIIIDNASFHKSAKTKQLIEEAGCFLMFLPAYSPDLNPIEHYWHKIKTLIRKLKRNLKISLESAMEKILDKETIY